MSQPVLPPVGAGAPGVDAMLRLILTSRVYDVCRETPLDAGASPVPAARQRDPAQARGPAAGLQLQAARRVQQDRAPGPEERARGVIAASAGNHAQGVAFSAQRLGIRAVIVMPQTTPEIKVQAVRDSAPRWCSPATATPRRKQRADDDAARDGTRAHPAVRRSARDCGAGDDRRRDAPPEPRDLDAVFVPVGGGGLIAGIGSYIKALMPDVRIIGVEPFEADAMYRSLAAGRRVRLDHVGSSRTALPCARWRDHLRDRPTDRGRGGPRQNDEIAPPSRTCSTTRAASTNQRARSRLRASRRGSSGTACAGSGWPPS